MDMIKGNVIVGQSGGPTAVIIPAWPGSLKPQKTEGQAKYTGCCTGYRD